MSRITAPRSPAQGDRARSPPDTSSPARAAACPDTPRAAARCGRAGLASPGEMDEALDPVRVRLLRAPAEIPPPHRLVHLLQQPGFRGSIPSGRTTIVDSLNSSVIFHLPSASLVTIGTKSPHEMNTGYA